MKLGHLFFETVYNCGVSCFIVLFSDGFFGAEKRCFGPSPTMRCWRTKPGDMRETHTHTKTVPCGKHTHIYHLWMNFILLMVQKSGENQLVGSFSHYLQVFLHLRWCRISSISSITSICLKWLEKLKKSSPKSWFNSNLPWYKITNHLKQISSIITMNFQFSLSSRRASRNSNPFLRQTYRWVSSRWFQPI